MSETASSSTSSKTSETLSIKMHDIPTELLERLLADFVQQINTVYRKRQGDIPIKDFEQNPDLENKEKKSRKRTLAELSRIEKKLSADDIIKERLDFSSKELQKYGIPHSLVNTILTDQATTTDEPIADVLAASIIEVIQQSIRSKRPTDGTVAVERSALSLMTRFVNLHILNLARRLQRLMEIQRRRLPNRDDLALLHREGIFDKIGIYDMYDLSKHWIETGNKRKAELLDSKAQTALSSYNGTDPHSFNIVDNVFLQNGEWWVDNIVERKKHKYYIPKWMPSLPPDYTYKATPKFNERITDPIVLREKLVNEGRIAEMALDHIIVKQPNDCDISSFDSEGTQNEENLEVSNPLPIDVASTNENIEALPITNSQKLDDREISAPVKSQDKILDLVEFARKRMEILNERRKAEEERIASRVNSEESYFGQTFGFYSKIKKFPDGISEELGLFRQKKLQELIRNLHKQEKHNIKWFGEQEILRKKIAEEKSKYSEANEIELGTGVSNNELNFGFANGDEEVDFDVDFSDMEDFTDSAAEPNMMSESVIGDSTDTVPKIGDAENETKSTIELTRNVEMIDTTTVHVSGKRPYIAQSAETALTETSEVTVTTPVPADDIAVSDADEEVDIDMDMFEES